MEAAARISSDCGGKFGPGGWLKLWVLFLVFGFVVAPAPSAAAPPQPFAKFCLEGSSAGKCLVPRGLAVSSTNGHIYVADQINRRINEFTAWGEFIKSWGWGVDNGAAELQTCTTVSGCQQGLAGTGVGQFQEMMMGVAVDSTGNIYVSDPSASRVQKFDPEGEFLLMFGGNVNQGPNNPGNVCTAAHIAGGDTCGAGSPGTGNGQFSPNYLLGNTIGIGSIAIGLDDEVYVGDEERIQVFDSGGVYQRQLPLPQPGSAGALAIDPVTGDVYMAFPNGREEFEQTLPDIYRLNESTGTVIDELEADNPSALATDDAGNVFVFDQMLIVGGSPSNPESHGTRILKFDSAGNLIEEFAETEIFGEGEIRRSVGIATSSFCFSGGDFGFYLASHEPFDSSDDYVQAYGPTPDPAKCLPPDVPPDLKAQFSSSVDTDSAVLKAEINPHYFTGAVGTTTYSVQWGTAECIASEGFEGACAEEQPVPAAVLDSPPGNEDVFTDPIVLEGLESATTYAYRFVVEREREEGSDPAVWVVLGVSTEFTTLPEETLSPCPNDAFRADAAGAGLHLRDCRAYELVSPLDKDGGGIQARLQIGPFDARVDQASLSGDEITFSAYRAFEDPQSAPFSSQYLTKRTSTNWQTEAISPPQVGEAFINPLLAIDNLYRAFSPDLSQAWVYTYTEPVLGTGGLAGHANVYRRDNNSDTYESCTTAEPLGPETDHGYQLQGLSADGDLAAFRVEAKLTPEASDEIKTEDRPITQAYVCVFDEEGNAIVRLVSVLPNGEASDEDNTIGGPANEQYQGSQGRTESLENAVSADGSKVFWTAGGTNFDTKEPGALYVRLNPAAPPTASGQCEESEPANACTVLISAGPARFWKASDDGAIAIFSEGGDLNEYEVATGEVRPIAEEVTGLLGASEDVSRIYFISEDEIGGEGNAEDPNLYLYDRAAESITFIATLSENDARQGVVMPSPGNYEPARHTARVTADGSTVAFMSSDPELAEEVAGYDNTDQLTGLPAAEIYRYEIGGEVVCISCNPTGQRPAGREIQNKFGPAPVLPAASMLPPWLNALYAPRVLSDDGNRIFFEAFEPLIARDTNDKADVYQWEAEGSGGGGYTCTASDPAYDPQSDGCVSLISSGKSPNDTQFVDASPSGNDVFIRTASSLVSWDPEAIDIYDARVEGGFPAPPSLPTECEGEAQCRPPATPAPADPALQTSQTGPGNPPAGKPKPKKCRKGTHKVKRKGKVRCVKNKKAGKAGKSGRAGR